MEIPNYDATLTPPEPIPPEQPSAVRKIFIGKDGLRAGWSLLIFIALLAAILFCVGAIAHKFFPSPHRSANAASEAPVSLRGFMGEAIPFFVLLLVTWIMSKIERRPNSVYGLGGSRRLRYFLAGLAWGFTCLSLLVLTLWKTGYLVIDQRLLFGSDILRYGAIWLLGFLLVGMMEEYLTRGYLQYTLGRGLAAIYQW
ncbi:MAG TPA: CPBP family intramembrane glutamate endopeptidase, partial [Candidatus Methylomirabilis sp.]|nr:CPBP family intramembrane glutamate endopeptidase [Candidatus Methylomirabilis sp.]